MLSTEGRTIGEIDDQIATVENQINTILEAAYQRRDGLRAKEIESIKKYNAEIAALEKEKLEIYRNAFIVETQKIILEGDQLTEEQAAQFYLNAQGLLDDANQSVQDAYNAELTRILNLEQAAKANGTFVESEFSKLRSQARAERDNALKENEQFYVDAMEAVTGFSQQVTGVSFENVFALQGELDRFTKEYTKNIDAHAGVINDLQKTFLGALFSPVDELIDNIWGYGAAADESLEKVLASYKKIDIEAYNTYLSMIANATSSGAEIGAENEAIVDSFLSMFEGVPKEVEKDAKKVLLGIISGMEKQIPGLENASNMSLEAIVGTLREGLNAQKGKELAGNLVSGMTTTLNNSTSIFSKLGSTIGSIFSSAFSNSSKVTVPRNYVSVDLDGSHAGGLDYVPFDGYVAELHKGERVLTADQARGYGSSTYNISIEVNGANYPNPDKLATTIAQKIQKMTDRRSAARA